MIISKDKKDWILYYDFLKEDKISSMPLKNLSPFPDIQWKKREIKTSEKAKIHKTEFIKEGVVMSFSLDKGCYATTFLSHFFQLMTGMPPKDISDKVVDIKEILGEKPIEDVIKKFESVTFSKSEDIGVTLLFGKTE